MLLALEETKRWKVEYSATHQSISLYHRDKVQDVLIERFSWEEPRLPLSGQSEEAVAALANLLKPND